MHPSEIALFDPVDRIVPVGLIDLVDVVGMIDPTGLVDRIDGMEDMTGDEVYQHIRSAMCFRVGTSRLTSHASTGAEGSIAAGLVYAVTTRRATNVVEVKNPTSAPTPEPSDRLSESLEGSRWGMALLLAPMLPLEGNGEPEAGPDVGRPAPCDTNSVEDVLRSTPQSGYLRYWIDDVVHT
jgi:hypothetical protein